MMILIFKGMGLFSSHHNVNYYQEPPRHHMPRHPTFPKEPKVKPSLILWQKGCKRIFRLGDEGIFFRATKLTMKEEYS